ncbi:MAG: VOC family protein [Gammaproteobacteria bacterium]|nr:VOC family protein [Gammaproteobacteria bacterium]
MRALIAAFLLLPGLCLAQVAAPPPPAEIVSTLSRVAILVSDLEASKRFYTYALGYEVSYDGDITRPAVITQLGLAPGQKAWFTVLRSSQVIAGQRQDGAMIGLLTITNPVPPAMQRPTGAALARGEQMFAIRTTDIAQVRARLGELGAPIVLEPMKSPDGKETELVTRDPDGTRLHVVER